MADNNTTQISKVLIDTTGDGQGDKTAHFAADIDNFMVYDDDGAESSVKDLVFGNTDPGTFKSTETEDNSMWNKLNTKTQECYNILNNNKSFWNGLSNASYEETTDGAYLASGTEVDKVNFYGEDQITAATDRKKLVPLGALEDFAKRIPTMGGYHDIGQDHVALNPNSSATGINSFAVNGGQATQKNSIAIGPGTLAWAEDQVVLGQYNQLDTDAQIIIGTGTSETNRRNGLKIDKDGNIWLPKVRKGSNNLNDNWEEYIGQDTEVSQTLPATFISGTFMVGYRNADKTWLGGQPKTFTLEKGVQASIHLDLGKISDSELIRADITYDGKYSLDIQGTRASMADGSEQSVIITLLYAEMCAINFF